MASSSINQPTQSPAIDLALDTFALKKQCLIFLGTKKSAEKTAEDLAKAVPLKPELAPLSEGILSALSRPTKQCERLSKCVSHGIAFHHAGLAQKQRELIEDAFRAGTLLAICCTPTLAYGVDTPAYRSIIKDVRRFGSHGLSWIPVLDYMQMAGRAGRPKFDNKGEAILLCATESEKDDLVERYIKGQPEDIFSKLAVEPALRSAVLSLVAAGFCTTKNALHDFFSRTFYAHQFQDLGRIRSIIEKILHQLEEWEFVVSSDAPKGDFQSADEIGKGNVRATLVGKRVAELYVDPLTAAFFIQCLRDGMSKSLESFSFLQMVAHTSEMRPLLRVKTKEYDVIQQELLSRHSTLLEREPTLYDPLYEEFLDSIKTALMLEGWINEKSEESMLEEHDVRPGELLGKLDTTDWLLYTSEELSRLLQFKTMLSPLMKLRMRVKYGAKEELLPLLRFEGIGRVRSRILFNARIRDVADIKNTPFATLKQLIGEGIALSLKKQVGEDVSQIPTGKRKGQMSLKKFNS